MHALVVYESIYGNTHMIAERIADGLRPHADVRVVAVGDATEEVTGWADLLVVGGPTHGHGMTRSNSRKGARQAAAKPGTELTLDPAADGPGIRDWIGSIHGPRGKRAAAFDTRLDAPALLTGRASSGIARELRRQGITLLKDPESFRVDRHNRLVKGELDRATAWGARLGDVLAPTH